MGDLREQNAATEAGTAHRETEARREFLRKIGRTGVTVPAVSLLLAANFEPSSAYAWIGSGGSGSSSLPNRGGGGRPGGGLRPDSRPDPSPAPRPNPRPNP